MLRSPSCCEARRSRVGIFAAVLAASWATSGPCWAAPPDASQSAVPAVPPDQQVDGPWQHVDAAQLEPTARGPLPPAPASMDQAGPEGPDAPSAPASNVDEGGGEGDGSETSAGHGASVETSAKVAVPPPQVDPGARPVAVAVGLGPEAPGSPDEKAIVEHLEHSVTMSVDPPTSLRVLRPGADARQVCGEGREDLVITVGYLPDRPAPVLLVHDCRLDVPLGVRADAAASDPDLVGVLWKEHEDLLAAGYKERRRNRLNPKVRSALIIGGATIAIGLALGLILANTLRDEVVVLKVSP